MSDEEYEEEEYAYDEEEPSDNVYVEEEPEEESEAEEEAEAAQEEYYGGEEPQGYVCGGNQLSCNDENNYGNIDYGHCARSEDAVTSYEQPQAPPSYSYERSAAERSFAEVSDEDGRSRGFDWNNMLQSSLGGLGGGSLGEIITGIGAIAGASGGLSNIMASGGMSELVGNLIGSAAHRFFGINPETGRIIGAIAGNIIFNLGGKDNSLGGIGKLILDNIISGKFKRKVKPFVSPTPGLPSFQLDFYRERDRCLQNRVLFEDPEFPATDTSLFYSKPCPHQIEWLRPGEIVNEPQLIVEGHSRFDVNQGALGDCWLLAAVANLTLRDELFYRVVPPDQSFTENYAGIFHFQFWRYGAWVDVVIDDRLPTKHGKLVYMHSEEHNEFWSALLEKAYAKLYGSYEALEGGSTAEALEDFTGGLIEHYDLGECPKEALLALMIRAFQMGSMFGCSIDADPSIKEAVQPNGLVRGHAYSVTALQKVYGPHGETVILRIRNPWGNDTEWNGAWSDNAQEWYYISEEQKSDMKVVFAQDGEFWMSFEDFVQEFMRMEVCNLGADVMDEICQMTGVQCPQSATWQHFIADGQWSVRNGTAGGCRNNIESFASNPQYGASVHVDESSVEGDGKCTMIVAVMQKYRRELQSRGLSSLPIGFSVYRCDYLSGRMGQRFFEAERAFANTHTFIDRREVTLRFRGPPGGYLIIPSTFDAHEEADFLLRIFANGAIQARNMTGVGDEMPDVNTTIQMANERLLASGSRLSSEGGPSREKIGALVIGLSVAILVVLFAVIIINCFTLKIYLSERRERKLAQSLMSKSTDSDSSPRAGGGQSPEFKNYFNPTTSKEATASRSSYEESPSDHSIQHATLKGRVINVYDVNV
uniref:Calpain catalytic domain-containing protein n=1 Tax=Ascaris lumbricoides TaxID=6252 RepID=A0A9J2PHU4_ASCLU